ncbi:hypothetical protein QBC43DRAFT_335613 [Cladorrhinum sp. PSN259]|nr:hypothetical protein QBC43DRAFT_335613 [Cladorrhinum sp. PSN259]
MCKARFLAFFCPKGWRDGWQSCPYYKPNPGGFIRPYMALWPETSIECCGMHQGECAECLTLYASPHNIQIEIKDLVECDNCQSAIDELRRNGQYEPPSEGQVRICMPDSYKRSIIKGLRGMIQKMATKFMELEKERQQEAAQWERERLLREFQNGNVWVQIPQPEAGVIPPPGFGGKANNVAPGQYGDGYDQQHVHQQMDQGYITQPQAPLHPMYQQQLFEQQNQQNEQFVYQQPFQQLGAQQGAFQQQQQHDASQPLFQGGPFNSSGQIQGGGEIMYQEQTYGFQPSEQDALDYLQQPYFDSAEARERLRLQNLIAEQSQGLDEMGGEYGWGSPY